MVLLQLLYNGWLGKLRGTDLIEKMIALKKNVKIIMAVGLLMSKCFTANNSLVDYRGIMSQGEALKIAADEADYILCVYAPTNETTLMQVQIKFMIPFKREHP